MLSVDLSAIVANFIQEPALSIEQRPDGSITYRYRQPCGGNRKEPVTESTKAARCFYALSRTANDILLWTRSIFKVSGVS